MVLGIYEGASFKFLVFVFFFFNEKTLKKKCNTYSKVFFYYFDSIDVLCNIYVIYICVYINGADI